jgi:hypothetical protein
MAKQEILELYFGRDAKANTLLYFLYAIYNKLGTHTV